jgi:hypothetical protein
MHSEGKDVSYPVNDDAYMNSLKCPDIQYVNVSKIDPSLALGFMFNSRESFNEWVEVITAFNQEFGVENMPFSIEKFEPVMDDDGGSEDDGEGLGGDRRRVDDDDDEDDEGMLANPSSSSSSRGPVGVMKHTSIGKDVEDDPEDEYVLL